MCVDHDAFDQDIYWTYLAPGYVRTELHDKLTNAKREDLSSFMVSAWTPTVLATHENVCVSPLTKPPTRTHTVRH